MLLFRSTLLQMLTKSLVTNGIYKTKTAGLDSHWGKTHIEKIHETMRRCFITW